MAKNEQFALKPRVAITYTFKNTRYRLVEGVREVTIDNRARRELTVEYSIQVDKMGEPIWLPCSDDDECAQGLTYALLDAIRLNEPKVEPKVIVQGDNPF